MSAAAAAKPAKLSWQLRLLETVWAGVVAGQSQWNPEKSCYDLANEYARSGRTVAECIDGFIDFQAAKAGAGGFVLGLPGLVFSAVSIPADLTMTTYIQLRMIAVIALLRGWDISANGLRTASFLCLLGSGAAGFMQQLGLDTKAESAPVMLGQMPAHILHKIESVIASKLLVSAGKTGVINFVSFVPVVGGIVNGGLDGIATRSIGRQANTLFRLAAKPANAGGAP